MEPIKFKPILKQTLWGGGKIVKFKGIEGHDGEQIGESWELSGVNGNESIAANGEYEGRRNSSERTTTNASATRFHCS